MTSWSEIICGYAMTLIDDERMMDKLTNDPARFFREMSLFLRLAIPRFNRPAEAVQMLRRHEEPKFGSFLWTADGLNAVDTGQVGFELCSVVIRSLDRYENPIETPYPQASYDPATGVVVFPDDVQAGTVFDMDFYTDGQFEQDLSPEMKRILGLCVQSVWESRFTSAWLPRTAKVSDRSFTPPNEANWTRVQEEKRRSLEATLSEELRQYEQNCAYRRIVSGAQNALM